MTEAELLAQPIDAYMNEAQQAFFRHLLLRRRAELQARIAEEFQTLREHEPSSGPSDIGTAEEQRHWQLRLLEREKKLLDKIDDSLDSRGSVPVSSRPRRSQFLRETRHESRSLVISNKRRETLYGAKTGPSLRVARQMAPGGVAGLGKGTAITCVPRLAWRHLAQQRGSQRNGNRPYPAANTAGAPRPASPSACNGYCCAPPQRCASRRKSARNSARNFNEPPERPS